MQTINRILKTVSSRFKVQDFINIRHLTVLGIETSCDDTAAAVVNDQKELLSQSAHSQQNTHLKYGGIIPPVAGRQHAVNIENVVETCLKEAGLELDSIDAIAVTNRPGLQMSLDVGVRYGKFVARKCGKPLVAIHHMEAHALMARMTEYIKFPYLCLLISGGHCQLAIVKGVDDFLLLGESIDDAPGEAFDKIARHLKLRNLSEFQWLNGGSAIETAAQKAIDINRYEFPLPLSRYRDCNFSFAGLKNNAKRHIKQETVENELGPDEIIPNYPDFCAGFLKAISRHICHRTQRAIEFCNRRELLPKDEPIALVVSGGVACNDVIFNNVAHVASSFGMKAYRPPKKLCSDNGVMIAWNGIEKILANPECLNQDIDDIQVIAKCGLGESIIEEVRNENIKCNWVKMPKVESA